MKNKILPLLASLFVVVSLWQVASVLAQNTTLSSGDILAGKNLTQSQANYSDPVSATAGERVRMRVRVVNTGTEDAQNVNVSFNLSTPTAPTVMISADNAASVNDFVNIDPSGASLNYVTGSAKKYGPVCPTGCTVGDEIVTTGVNLGTVNLGEPNSYQLSIEADIAGIAGGGNAPVFRGGNIFDGGNRTDRLVDWQDPIPADPGEVIEFRVTVINDGTADSENTTVRVVFPPTYSTNITSTAYILGSGATTISDTAVVNISGTEGQRLVYLPGHTLKFGPGCPSTGCSMPDGITGYDGIAIGRVVPGVTNSYQITFKAHVSNIVPSPSPSPSPTPTPSVSPSPSPTPSPSASPTPTPSVSPTPTPSPQVLGTTAPTRLPETGDDTGVLLILAGIGFGIVGVYLFKRFRLV